MKNINITYKLKWRFKNYNHIQVSECGKIFNTQTGRRKKICVNGSSVGIWIESKKFILKNNLNNHIELIPKFEDVKKSWLNYL